MPTMLLSQDLKLEFRDPLEFTKLIRLAVKDKVFRFVFKQGEIVDRDLCLINVVSYGIDVVVAPDIEHYVTQNTSPLQVAVV